MAELIPVGEGADDSADFTLNDGETATLFLKHATGTDIKFGAVAQIQVKADGQYFTIGSLSSSQPMQVLAAKGTFRVSRPEKSASCGVERG